MSNQVEGRRLSHWLAPPSSSGAEGGTALTELEQSAYWWNRHREERSDVAIQESRARSMFPWIASLRSQ